MKVSWAVKSTQLDRINLNEDNMLLLDWVDLNEDTYINQFRLIDLNEDNILLI
jgi:hypothetical protein